MRMCNAMGHALDACKTALPIFVIRKNYSLGSFFFHVKEIISQIFGVIVSVAISVVCCDNLCNNS